MTELEAAIIEGEELIETEYDTGDQYPKWLLELLAASRAYAAILKLVPEIGELVEANKTVQEYDAGSLNDYGGGNVEWWQDYIRAELGRAHDFYQSKQGQEHHILKAIHDNLTKWGE